MNEHESISDSTISSIVEQYRELARNLQSGNEPLWLELDLSMAQLKTLLVINDHGSLPINQVAEMLGVGAPTASQLVDRLVHARLVERADDPADRRRALTRLSPEGLALVERLRHGPRERLRVYLAALSAEELAGLQQGLRALCLAARQSVHES